MHACHTCDLIRLLPLFAGLILFWPGLTAWFQKDDFAWLGLLDMAATPHGLLQALFEPMAQGTIRTLGERVPFLVLRGLFGVNPLPFRILSFLTFCAVVLLIERVTARITGSAAAGIWAAMLWMASGAVGVVMAWASPFHELLLAATMLAALDQLTRYSESGAPRHLAAQWLLFLGGFLVTEQNVVYPALALAYALTLAPKLVRTVLPMFVASALYVAVHLWAAPASAAEPYRLHWDTSMATTLWAYWKLAMGPNQLIHFQIHPSIWRSALTVLLTAGLLVFLISELWRGRRIAALFALWFLATLAPFLPLRNHISEYYLAVPRFALAMWGAWAFIAGWRAGAGQRIAATLVLVTALGVGVPIAWINAQSFHDRAAKIHRAVEKVRAAVGENKDRVVVLHGVDPDLFWSGIYHRPLRFWGIQNVYVSDGDRPGIEAGGDPEQAAPFFFHPANATPGPILSVDMKD